MKKITERLKELGRTRGVRLILFGIAAAHFLVIICTLSVSADEETLPTEYSDFIGSIDSEISDMLPEGVFSKDRQEVEVAAEEMISPLNILYLLVDALGVGITSAAPTMAVVIGVVVLAALLSVITGGLTGVSRAVEMCIRACTFAAISAVAVECASKLGEYFDRLFSAVASFLPLSAVLYAMGGNLTAAASTGTTLGITLSVCQFFCTKTVIPIFCLCLCLTLLSVFDTQGAAAGGAVGTTIRKWYTTSLSFVMMILTVSVAGSGILASKADSLAMRGAKFAVSSFVPISGGTVSSTLGTLAASVEMLRGSVGVIGITIIILMLVPTVVELALMRAVFAIGGFCASTLGCTSESRLLSELDSLYGYLEGIAVLSAAVFIISFGVFAAISTPFG